MLGRYKLVGKIAVSCEDTMEWGTWMETGDRRVAEDYIGSIWVSTIFLALDHNFSGHGDPLLFETMMFGVGDDDVITARTHTWGEAEETHRAAVALARQITDNADTIIPEGWERKKTEQEKC